jgi:hypothetical protein
MLANRHNRRGGLSARCRTGSWDFLGRQFENHIARYKNGRDASGSANKKQKYQKLAIEEISAAIRSHASALLMPAFSLLLCFSTGRVANSFKQLAFSARCPLYLDTRCPLYLDRAYFITPTAAVMRSAVRQSHFAGE